MIQVSNGAHGQQMTLPSVPLPVVAFDCRVAMASEILAEALRLAGEGFYVSAGSNGTTFNLLVAERTCDVGPQLPGMWIDGYSRRDWFQCFESTEYRHRCRVAFLFHISLTSDNAALLLEEALGVLIGIAYEPERYVTRREVSQ